MSTVKKHRYKGKARMQGVELIRKELANMYAENDPEALLREQLDEEIDEAMYCCLYGPCKVCIEITVDSPE